MKFISHNTASNNQFIPIDQLRLGENQIAEVYIENKWVPICGHWFWNNNIGATLFCQEMGFESGYIKSKHGNFDLGVYSLK